MDITSQHSCVFVHCGPAFHDNNSDKNNKLIYIAPSGRNFRGADKSRLFSDCPNRLHDRSGSDSELDMGPFSLLTQSKPICMLTAYIE